MRCFVLNENTFVIPIDECSLQVLASSVIRGATNSWRDGVVARPVDDKGMRPATIEDFDTFMVYPSEGYMT